MTKRARRRAWLAALWGAAFGLGFGCTDGSGSSAQVLTGRVDIERTGVIAIRAVAGEEVVTAARVGGDGSFRIALPAGARYRLEALTAGGVKHVLAEQDGTWQGLELGVCVPSAPFDLGELGPGDSSGGMCDPTDPNCKTPCDEPPSPCMDPMDPSCDCKADGSCPPPPCMDPTDPNCDCKANGSCPPCGGPNEPPCPEPEPCDPTDPWCQCKADGTCPPPCMDPMDPNCDCMANGTCPPPSCGGPNEPACPECMDPTDPGCQCKSDGTCPEPQPCTDPSDPSCMGGTCEDPMDPETCKDPCVIDPMHCGCTSEDPNGWPPPEPPMCMGDDKDNMCDPGQALTPTHVPGDFGCSMGFVGK